MSQMMTQAECVDHMWDQRSSKVLKLVGILGDRVTLKQLSTHEFTCTQDKRDLLAGRIFAMNAEGKPPEGRVLVSDLAKSKGL